MPEYSNPPDEEQSWPKIIKETKWTNVTTTIGDPLNQKSLREVGLYNGALLVWDKTLSQFPQNEFVRKKRVYAGSKFAIDPDHANKDESISMDLGGKELQTALEKHRKEFLYSDVQSPDFIRARRKILMDELHDLEKDGSWDEKSDKIIRKVADLDRIGHDFVTNQRIITVTSDEAGGVSSIMTRIDSPVMTESGERVAKDKPLIVSATGYGNDPRGGAPKVVEIALNGRDVIHISYPDAYGAEQYVGKLHPRFVNLVEKSQGLTAQAEFFKECVRQIIRENPGRKVELWGQSTGCLIWATALNDPEFAKEIEGVVLIHPAGIVDVENQKTEFVKEGKQVAISMTRAAQYSFVIGATDTTKPEHGIVNNYPAMLAQSIGENALGMGERGKIWKKVMTETRKAQPVYDNIQPLKSGKPVLRVNATGDTTTMSFKKTPGKHEVSVNYEGTHADTNLRPDTLIPFIMEENEKLPH